MERPAELTDGQCSGTTVHFYNQNMEPGITPLEWDPTDVLGELLAPATVENAPASSSQVTPTILPIPSEESCAEPPPKKQRKRYISSSDGEDLEQPSLGILYRIAMAAEEEERAETPPEAAAPSLGREPMQEKDWPLGYLYKTSIVYEDPDKASPPLLETQPIQKQIAAQGTAVTLQLISGLQIPAEDRIHPKNARSAMKGLIRASLHTIIKAVLQKKLVETCQGCVLQSPGQLSHNCFEWTRSYVNQILCTVSGRLYIPNIIGFVVLLAHSLGILQMDPHLFDFMVSQIEAIYMSSDAQKTLDNIVRKNDKKFIQYAREMLSKKNYKSFLAKKM